MNMLICLLTLMHLGNLVVWTGWTFTSIAGSWFRYHLIHHLWQIHIHKCFQPSLVFVKIQHSALHHVASFLPQNGSFTRFTEVPEACKAPDTQFGFLLLCLPIAVSRCQPCPARGHLEMPAVPRSSQRCWKQIHESISVSFIYGWIMYFTRFQLSFQRKFVSQRPHKQNYLVLMIIRLWFITIFCRKIIFYKDKSERWSLMILMCWNNDQHDP